MNARDKNGVVNIHGKEYQTVAYRVTNFRAAYPLFTLKTSILHRDVDCVVMLAEIFDESGRLIANGHAEEYRNSSSINKTSALENSETSAIGRALAAFGLGGTEFATADEVANAITKKQPAKESFKSIGAAEGEKIPAEVKSVLEGLAIEVIADFDKVPTEQLYDTYTQVRDNCNDPGEVAYLRSLFPSHIMTAFQRISKAREDMSLAGVM